MAASSIWRGSITNSYLNVNKETISNTPHDDDDDDDHSGGMTLACWC